MFHKSEWFRTAPLFKILFLTIGHQGLKQRYIDVYRPQFVVIRFQIGTARHLTRVRVIVTFTRHRQFLIIVHGGAKIFLLINRLRCPHLLQGVRTVGGQNNHRHTAVLGFHHSRAIMGQRRPRCTH